MKLPEQRPQRQISETVRRALAARARYTGSAEHKPRPSWLGLGAPQLHGGRIERPGKQTTTICPLTKASDRERATDWVRNAIIAGQYRFFESDQDFPKKIWYEADDTIWIGYILNPGSGEYKGWPISERERNAVFG